MGLLNLPDTVKYNESQTILPSPPPLFLTLTNDGWALSSHGYIPLIFHTINHDFPVDDMTKISKNCLTVADVSIHNVMVMVHPKYVADTVRMEGEPTQPKSEEPSAPSAFEVGVERLPALPSDSSSLSKALLPLPLQFIGAYSVEPYKEIFSPFKVSVCESYKLTYLADDLLVGLGTDGLLFFYILFL
jgi:hypothetical protein